MQTFIPCPASYQLPNTSNLTLTLPSIFTPIIEARSQTCINLSSVQRQSKKNRSKRGKWNSIERKQYIRFLKENIEEMRVKCLRKSEKVFNKMSKIIRTRTPDQCRSHHRKAIKCHSSLQQLVRHYSKKESNIDYRPYFKKFYEKGAPTSANSSNEVLIESYSRKQNNFRFLINSALIANY